METIKVSDLVIQTAKEVKMPELLVHLRLQEAARRLGVGWGYTLDTVTAVLVVDEASKQCKW